MNVTWSKPQAFAIFLFLFRAVSSNEISGSPSSMDTVDYHSTHNSRLIKKRKIDESDAEDTENEMF